MDLKAEAKGAWPVSGNASAIGVFSYAPGGRGASQAVGVSRLGVPAALIGCVGRDEFGSELRASLGRNGVDVDGVCFSSRRDGSRDGGHADEV